jgi:2-polyprenyl-6-methoxyphenol hydroxylase-like FAD-dependent oxidoreductase
MRAPLRILVLGGGTAGWMAANMLARAWPKPRSEIAVVESSDIGIIGVGEGSTPQLRAFFRDLGLAERDWMPKCNATYKNGIEFRGWSDKQGFDRYFHPFPSHTDDRTAPAFYFNAYVRRRGADVWAHPDRFFLASRLAAERKGPLVPEHFPFEVAYGYHFDAYLVGAMLREHAKTRGVAHIEGKVSGIERREDGDIAALVLEDGRRLEADIFIDSSGFRSVLLQTALGVPFRSFRENLFNDSAVVMPTPNDAAGPECQTTSTALGAGWLWKIPLTNRAGNGYVYSSDFISSEDAERELRNAVGMTESPVEARHLKMKVGRVERTWEKNCIAVGLSQGFIEPLEATALHIVQETVHEFIEAYDQGGFTPARRDAFNATIAERIEGVRDYIVCHYKVNHRSDTEYWRANAANDKLSDSLRAILDVWRRGEDLSREVDRQNIAKYYATASWHCLLAGYGVYPDVASLRPPNERGGAVNMSEIDEFMRRCALNFRPHREMIAAA